MNLAEKVLRAKADYDAVYEAGKAAGGGVVDPDPIPVTATGVRCVSVNDVSEIPHDVSVQLSSDTITDFSGVKVWRYGKNLLDCGTVEFEQNKTVFKSTTAPFPAGTYAFSAKITSTDTDGAVCFVLFFDTDGGQVGTIISRGARAHGVVTTVKPITEIRVYAGGSNANSIGDTAIFEDCQLEIGASSTVYEPFTSRTAYSVNTDGSVDGVTSLPLNMTVFADADASLTVGYNKSKGVQIVYDMFWDTYQQNGNRTSYDCAFYGRCWTDDIFDPKYKMIPTNMSQCFYGANNITRDLTADMIDTSRCTNMYFAFSGLSCTSLPVVDMRAVTAYSSARYPFYNCTRLRTIEGLYLPQVGVEKPFHNCESLREVRLLGDGKFLINVDMGVCPLSKASIESVMAALSDTVTGQTATFNKTAVDAAFETSEGAADGSTSDAWTAIVASKPNWTFTLA